MLLTDFCNRLTTRAPVDRLAPEPRGFRLADRAPTGREPDDVRRQPTLR
jgi:hypothetical protein